MRQPFFYKYKKKKHFRYRCDAKLHTCWFDGKYSEPHNDTGGFLWDLFKVFHANSTRIYQFKAKLCQYTINITLESRKRGMTIFIVYYVSMGFPNGLRIAGFIFVWVFFIVFRMGNLLWDLCPFATRARASL